LVLNYAELENVIRITDKKIYPLISGGVKVFQQQIFFCFCNCESVNMLQKCITGIRLLPTKMLSC